MKIKKFIPFLVMFALSSCTVWTPPPEEPVLEVPIVVEPSVITTSPPPPPAPAPAPEVVIVEEPEPVVLQSISEPETVLVEAVSVLPNEDAPDEVLNGELDFASAFEDKKTDKETVTVYYGTNRVLRTNEEGQPVQSEFPEEIYGEIPGPLHYGKALISIPPRHKAGRLETNHLGRSSNDKRYVVLADLVHADYETVMAEVQGELAKDADGKRTIIAYVHGFNTTFEKAARRAGQLKFDLSFQGPLFFFSWPSKASVFGYTHAANLAEISYTQMTEFLSDLAKQDADRIIVIAHSMGTRVFSHGLVDLAARDPEAAKKITRVILAAPDIDARVFKERLLPKMSFLKNPITLYASDKDTALAASKEVNGLPRIGDVSGGLQELDNVIMIDASDVKSNLMNHTYFGDSISIVDDFRAIVSGPVEAEKRNSTLIRSGVDPQQLWKVLPFPSKPNKAKTKE
jgi:esterase/lipase superfamily enzyme